jgi:hypothetical protein
MIALKEQPRAGVTGVGYAMGAQDLSMINDPSSALVLCQRQANSGMLSWLETLTPEQLPKARVILRPEVLRKALSEICEIAQTPVCLEREQLIEDIAELGSSFAKVMKAPYLRLRLDTITTNACHRFHVDALSARLICTYRGTGTQYGGSVDGAEPEVIHTVPTGTPIVLRGSLWPETPASGILHRSPPIEGTGEYRCVLVLDPVHELENENYYDGRSALRQT